MSYMRVVRVILLAGISCSATTSIGQNPCGEPPRRQATAETQEVDTRVIARITAVNSIPKARNQVTLAVLLDKRFDSGIAYHVVDEEGILRYSQTVDSDGDGHADQLLFQANFCANQSRTFSIREGDGKSPPPEDRVHCGFYPQQYDSLCWENDKVAFKFYGPKMRDTHVDGGVDCWFKRVPYPMIDRWWAMSEQGKSYHIDYGQGHDPYHIGHTLGCGGSSVWANGRLYRTNTFAKHHILASGPLRCVFELTYRFPVEDKLVVETKRVTLDRGSRMFHVQSAYHSDGKPYVTDVAIGLTVVTGDFRAVQDHTHFVACWEKIEDSEIGTGAVVSGKHRFIKVPGDDKEPAQVLLICRTNEEGIVDYHAGYGWKKAGDIVTLKAWEAYLLEYSEQLHKPVTIRMSN